MAILENHVAGFFANHDARGVGVPRNECRHDRRICNSQAVYSAHLELIVDHRHGVAGRPHLVAAGRVVSPGVVAHEAGDDRPPVVGKAISDLAGRLGVSAEAIAVTAVMIWNRSR